MKYIIIGGVAAGMSAASKLKRVDKGADVTVYERGDVVSYGACGLPYFVAGINDDAEKMVIRSPRQFSEQGIDVRTGFEATALDAGAKTVTLRPTSGGSAFAQPYDKLMIAAGATPIVPPLPGAGLPGVHLLKTIDDGKALRQALHPGARVAVAGGGFIGVEVAESLQEAGYQVQLFEAAPHILAAYDPEIREILQQRMQAYGIGLHLGEAIQAVLEQNGKAAGLRTAQGDYAADVVVMALGVRPATAFLKDSGLQMAPNDAIEVDRQGRTSLPDVWAAGDCAMVYDRVQQRNVYLPLGTVANKCGRIVGSNMGGCSIEFDGCLSSSAIRVCGLEAARTGMGEDTARQLLGEVQTVFVESGDFPVYYPGGTPLWIKLICEKGSRRIVGGQIVGEKGAVLRVDALAAAITAGMDAPTLGMADFCYAPPFSMAWDALNIAGNAVK